MPVYDVEGSGDCHPFSDGLIILKYIIGIRGEGLISGGLSPGSTRTTPEAISDYIETIWWTLDVDGDGKVVYSDGLTILLYMVGLRDANLDNGNIAAHSIRNTADKIEAYIARMVA